MSENDLLQTFVLKVLNLNVVLVVLAPIVIILKAKEETGNAAVRRQEFAHEKKWDGNKKSLEMWWGWGGGVYSEMDLED